MAAFLRGYTALVGLSSRQTGVERVCVAVSPAVNAGLVLLGLPRTRERGASVADGVDYI